MNKKVLLIVGGLALVACLVCVVFVLLVVALGVGATQPAADVGEAFMAALKSGDYSQAYNLCAPALQKEVGGNAAGLERLVKNGRVEPTGWTFTSRNVENNVAQLTGTATFTGNRQGTVRVTLNQIGNDWKVVGFNLKEQ